MPDQTVMQRMAFVWIVLRYTCAVFAAIPLGGAVCFLIWYMTLLVHGFEFSDLVYLLWTGSLLFLGELFLAPALWSAMRLQGASRKHGRIAIWFGLVLTVPVAFWIFVFPNI